MAFLQIGSNNPQFSFVLRKNPSSGMLVRSLKAGTLFGYYSHDASVFNCFFKDADWEISYKRFRDESFEYVNPSQYNAPEFVLDTISEFFGHIIKKENEGDVEGFDNFVVLNMISIKPKYLDIFSKYFTSVTIEPELICPNNYRLKFSTKGTMKELLSFVQLFTIFNVLKGRHLDEAEIQKYMGQLINIKAPYFIKYVFKVNILGTQALFKKHKAALEANSFEKIEFSFGYASLQRIQAVEKLLNFDNDIVDFGCGEGNFIHKFMGKVAEGKTYFAVDMDLEALDVAVKRVKEAPNVEFSQGYPIDSLKLGDHDMIMSEVIEHMEKKDAGTLVRDLLLLGGERLKKLIITTPNKDFNQFYFFDDEEMRHEDHHFEMSKEEFEAWIPTVAGHRSYQIFEIGDKVNDICCTLGAVIS